MALVAMTAGLAFASCDDAPLPGGTETAKWVDLGLPSGLLWAECNLGATKPEEYGDYYAWGETAPKEVYNWSTYMFCSAVDEDGWFKTLSKYNTDSYYGTVDSLTTLQAADDAATAKLGTGARMPTADEWRELIANTTAEWTAENGVHGCKLTSKTNGKSLFLPAAGSRRESEPYCVGEIGVYWTSSLRADYPVDAWYYGFNLYWGFQGLGDDYRCSGLRVRAVRQN